MNKSETTAKSVPAKPRATSAERGNKAPSKENNPEHQSPQGDDQSESKAETPFGLLEAIGIQITAAHKAANRAFVEVLLSAAKCGLLLLAAKDVVKPGFEAWFEQMGFPFTKATRCKYMRLADRLCEEAQSKPGLLLSMQPGTNGLPASFTFDELRLRTIIDSVADGRSLSELYIDWDIVKRAHNTNNITVRSAGEEESPEEVFGRWSKVSKGLPFIFARLRPDVQAALVTDLEGLLTKLKSIQQAPRAEN